MTLEYLKELLPLWLKVASFVGILAIIAGMGCAHVNRDPVPPPLKVHDTSGRAYNLEDLVRKGLVKFDDNTRQWSWKDEGPKLRFSDEAYVPPAPVFHSDELYDPACLSIVISAKEMSELSEYLKRAGARDMVLQIKGVPPGIGTNTYKIMFYPKPNL